MSQNTSVIHSRTIWVHPTNRKVIQVIDQRTLPHLYKVADLHTSDEVAQCIKEMWVRGAPLIGATAAYGMYLGSLEAKDQADIANYMKKVYEKLYRTRPTAVNLKWALERQMKIINIGQSSWDQLVEALFLEAGKIVEEDVEICYQIGLHGLSLIEDLYRVKENAINILTHCNAGRMATTEWGTATAPIYLAHQRGIPVHVWVDETRPRNQGANITSWELKQAGIPHTVIVDNMGGHLMQHAQVDICIVGTDRTTRQGDVANKIGTYLKALAAHDNHIPFYVALPSPTIDWSIKDGVREIPIEERNSDEVNYISGWDEIGNEVCRVRLTAVGVKGLNYGFDVTPAKYITGLITERGICLANEPSLLAMFPEMS